MRAVFYTRIRLAMGQREDQVITKAHALGYELVPFNGWDAQDLGYPGNPGPRRTESRLNLTRCLEIQDACVVHSPAGDDWPQIFQSQEPASAPPA